MGTVLVLELMSPEFVETILFILRPVINFSFGSGEVVQQAKHVDTYIYRLKSDL